jgi:hypothetical protein
MVAGSHHRNRLALKQEQSMNMRDERDTNDRMLRRRVANCIHISMLDETTSGLLICRSSFFRPAPYSQRVTKDLSPLISPC